MALMEDSEEMGMQIGLATDSSAAQGIATPSSRQRPIRTRKARAERNPAACVAQDHLKAVPLEFKDGKSDFSVRVQKASGTLRAHVCVASVAECLGESGRAPQTRVFPA